MAIFAPNRWRIVHQVPGARDSEYRAMTNLTGLALLALFAGAILSSCNPPQQTVSSIYVSKQVMLMEPAE